MTAIAVLHKDEILKRVANGDKIRVGAGIRSLGLTHSTINVVPILLLSWSFVANCLCKLLAHQVKAILYSLTKYRIWLSQCLGFNFLPVIVIQ